MSTIKANQWLNPDGTENYKCRAWVNFNGTGTIAIRASGNVASLTDNGVGDWTINFTSAMPDTNYSISGNCQMASVAASVNIDLSGISGFLTSSVRVRASGGNATTDAVYDTPIVTVNIFR